jgi:hypothetical protein
MVGIIILRHRAAFDTERFRNWLGSRSDTLIDPLGSSTFMVGGSSEVAEYLREKRTADPSQFPYCVLISINPEEISVNQEYGDSLKLLIAREFVKMVIEETGCQVFDEYGKDWTERVRREGIEVLYPPALT